MATQIEFLTRSNSPIPRGGYFVSVRFCLKNGVPVSYQRYSRSGYMGQKWDWDKIASVDISSEMSKGITAGNLSTLYDLLG